jgi:hypothetical protein
VRDSVVPRYSTRLFADIRQPPEIAISDIYIAWNGIRAICVSAALEENLGRVQAAFWYALRQAGVAAEVDGWTDV